MLVPLLVHHHRCKQAFASFVFPWHKALCPHKEPDSDAYSRTLRLNALTGGTLYVCGWNPYGRLGLGDTANRPTPTPMPVPTGRAWMENRSPALGAEGKYFFLAGMPLHCGRG